MADFVKIRINGIDYYVADKQLRTEVTALTETVDNCLEFVFCTSENDTPEGVT